MYRFYPQAGVIYNPPFTDLKYANYAREIGIHAAHLYQMTFAAFARAADHSQGEALQRSNFEFLAQAGRDLVALYRIAQGDVRVDEAKVGVEVNRLFWAIIGAAETILGFEDEDDDWANDWHSGLYRGGLLARLAVDLALAGAAAGRELGEMTAGLTRLQASTAKVRDYHFLLVREVPEGDSSVLDLAGEAGRLSAMLEEAVARLGARMALETNKV